MEELLVRHRKEAKDLQNKITSKKKQASKKTRKGVNDECDRLEQELKSRQSSEIAELNGTTIPDSSVDTLLTSDDLADGAARLSIGSDVLSHASQETVTHPPPSTITDAQDVSQQSRRVPRARARMERRKAEQEALFNQASAEASNLPDLKAQERERMVSNFRSRGLTEKEIRADGHCLYSAFADQMDMLGLPLFDRQPGDEPKVGMFQKLSDGITRRKSMEDQKAKLEEYKVVRKEAAQYIETHSDDFVPFLEEDLGTYVSKIRDTAEWGGQMELIALAKRYGVQINVLQGDGRVEEILPEDNSRADQVLWLAYYKHGFGLGEHYNSLRKTP
ncbi:NADH-cytochrome b5 reductase 2 [Sphaceloma murrayae]|uniref:NADH-cytochrome b5 reductase 2 n=1 Tax=Sphaceloma murrayae TaxID=2082308 RepID=A0A2K1QVT1_9PEZI|nr:NADH-cytochrome b5 reductase 2 [Sphaceloma murrayae]